MKNSLKLLNTLLLLITCTILITCSTAQDTPRDEDREGAGSTEQDTPHDKDREGVFSSGLKPEDRVILTKQGKKLVANLSSKEINAEMLNLLEKFNNKRISGPSPHNLKKKLMAMLLQPTTSPSTEVLNGILKFAAEKNFADIAELVLKEKGFEVLDSTLSLAVQKNSKRVVKTLLHRATIADKSAEKAILLAAKEQRVEIFKRLIKKYSNLLTPEVIRTIILHNTPPSLGDYTKNFLDYMPIARSLLTAIDPNQLDEDLIKRLLQDSVRKKLVHIPNILFEKAPDKISEELRELIFLSAAEGASTSPINNRTRGPLGHIVELALKKGGYKVDQKFAVKMLKKASGPEYNLHVIRELMKTKSFVDYLDNKDYTFALDQALERVHQGEQYAKDALKAIAYLLSKGRNIEIQNNQNGSKYESILSLAKIDPLNPPRGPSTEGRIALQLERRGVLTLLRSRMARDLSTGLARSVCEYVLPEGHDRSTYDTALKEMKQRLDFLKKRKRGVYRYSFFKAPYTSHEMIERGKFGIKTREFMLALESNINSIQNHINSFVYPPPQR